MAGTGNLETATDAMRALHEALAQRILSRVDGRRDDDGLTTAQRLALTTIAAGPCGPSDLAVHQGVAVSTATRMMDGLERAGFIAPAADTGDRRRRDMSITDAGRTALAAADEVLSGRIRTALVPLDDDDRETLIRASEIIRAAVARARSAAREEATDRPG